MTTPNDPKPTFKDLLTEFIAECGIQLLFTLLIGMLGTLAGFVIWAGFWSLFLLLPFCAVIYQVIQKHQKSPKSP